MIIDHVFMIKIKSSPLFRIKYGEIYSGNVVCGVSFPVRQEVGDGWEYR